MEYQFYLDKDEDLEKGLLRVWGEQITFIQSILRSRESRMVVVHSARKSFKRIRSLLRLLRLQFGEDWFDDQNAYFRELAFQISDMRDAHVLLETVENLHQDPSVKISLFNTEIIIQFILKNIQEEEMVLANENTTKSIADTLSDQTLTSEMDSLSNDLNLLIPGIQKIYADGYEAMQQAYLNPSTENFHEWRKDVKHLMHIRQFLDYHWPVTANFSIVELKELSDALGLDHDLANLREYIVTLEQDSMIDKKMLDRFLTDIQSKRQKLNRLAEHLGKHVYAETSEYFIKHFQNKWKGKSA